MIIWLQGPSGAGKSTVGRALAERRGLPFVDLDAEVERVAGKSIVDIFWNDGEAAFRGLEWNALMELFENDRSPKVIALGGGAVADSSIRGLMRATGLRVFLDVDVDVAMERVASGEPRPLLFEEDPAAKWRKLYVARRRYYEEADLILRSDGALDDVVRAVDDGLRALAVPSWSVAASVGGEPTRIAGFPSLHALVAHLRALVHGRQVCMIVDETVGRLYGDYLFPDDEREGLMTLTVGSGEEGKSLRSVEDLAAGLVAGGITRDAVIVGIGGGVVTDMAGFLAAIFMRGVRAIYVPTTLLAQVDAAIGGKTAVNAAGARNLLGVYRQPSDVLIAPAFLHTLEARELRSGFVEALKMGIINSAALADEVDAALPAIGAGNIPENIGAVIRAGVRAKLDVVEQDAHDASLRLSLNFGHTFGHALEAAEPGVHAHGEAVAFGMIAAAAMACEAGAISDARCRAITDRCRPFVNPAASHHNPAALLRAMAADKKRDGPGFRFILPTEETGFTIYPTDDRELVVRAMEKAGRRIEEEG